MLQAALPCLFMAQPSQQAVPAMPEGNVSVLELRGGTDAAMAPPVGYVQHVLLPMLSRLQGVEASINLHRRGFFPKVSTSQAEHADSNQFERQQCVCVTTLF